MKARTLRIDPSKIADMLTVRGLTQMEVAAKMGKSRSLINYWFQGKSGILEPSIRQLCYLLECNAEDLLTADALAFLRQQDKENLKAGVK